MKKNSSKRTVAKRVKKRVKKEKVQQLPLSVSELAETVSDSLHNFSVEIGQVLAVKLLEDEVQRLCGPRYEHSDERQYYRYGTQRGTACVGGQKVPISKPRVRNLSTGKEAKLETYASLNSSTAMPQSVLKRIVRNVTTRDYEGVIDVACEGFGIKRSSVSRQYVRASTRELEKLRSRSFADKHIVAILIDGIEFANETLVVAVGVDSEARKHVLGLRQGATENAEVVTSLLEELCERGIGQNVPRLFVIDGAKALAKAVRNTFGKKAFIQRCQVHKKRNILAHLAGGLRQQVSERLSKAYGASTYEKALQELKSLHKWLNRVAPDAAASLEEGMEETLTVTRLKLPPKLKGSLASTNIIESAFSRVRQLTRRVKRWRDGDMRLRWCSTALLRAEESFQRIQGYVEITSLITALDQAEKQKKLDFQRLAA